MVKGVELAAVGGCPAHTLYITVVPALTARSRGWAQACRAAFERALMLVCDEVVSCVLNGHGHAICRDRIERRGLGFRVAFCGTRIFIDVLDFEGPHDPGPNGGTRKARPARDRVLGVYVSDGTYYFANFYGPRLRGPCPDGFIGYGYVSYARRWPSQPLTTAAFGSGDRLFTGLRSNGGLMRSVSFNPETDFPPSLPFLAQSPLAQSPNDVSTPLH